jgi:pyrroline-5-carboxylate reductase
MTQRETTPLRHDPSIAFIGGGNMARSLIGGLLARGAAAASLRVAEPNASAREALAREFGVATFDDNARAVADAEIWLLAVKPQVMASVCTGLRASAAAGRATVVSIAAGISSAQIDAWLGGGQAVVRCMPNTPALLGAGVTGVYANPRVSTTARARVMDLMAAVGHSVAIDDESLMDAVTAVSGSGPAYVFALAEAWQAAAQAQGLPAEAARTLVNQTILGAARMLIESGESATTLRQRVTSPGGTTQAALESLRTDDFDALFARAIAAATRRGAELAAAASV